MVRRIGQCQTDPRVGPVHCCEVTHVGHGTHCSWTGFENGRASPPGTTRHEVRSANRGTKERSRRAGAGEARFLNSLDLRMRRSTAGREVAEEAQIQICRYLNEGLAVQCPSCGQPLARSDVNNRGPGGYRWRGHHDPQDARKRWVLQAEQIECANGGSSDLGGRRAIGRLHKGSSNVQQPLEGMEVRARE